MFSVHQQAKIIMLNAETVLSSNFVAFHHSCGISFPGLKPEVANHVNLFRKINFTTQTTI